MSSFHRFSLWNGIISILGPWRSTQVSNLVQIQFSVSNVHAICFEFCHLKEKSVILQKIYNVCGSFETDLGSTFDPSSQIKLERIDL